MGILNKAKSSEDLKKQFKQEEERKASGGGKKDLRFVNHWDLEVGEKMTIRLLPDGGDSGEWWLEYGTHGSKLENRSVKAIDCCYHSSGEDCPICFHSMDLYKDKDKDEAARWQRKESYIGQCLVMKSDVEVQETEDGNPVKLFRLTYGIIEVIQEAIAEDRIGNILEHDLIIKKSKGKNGYDNYNKSYFETEATPRDDEVLEAFENGELTLFDLSEELPPKASTEEAEEWLEDALDKERKAKKRGGKSNRDDSDDSDDDKSDDKDDEKSDDDEKPQKKSASALLDKINKKKKQD